MVEINGMATFCEGGSIDNKESISIHHIIFGEISACMYKALGDIRPYPASHRCKHILLQPHFVNGLDSFYCEHDSPYGKIISAWKRKNNLVVYEITIPPGSAASLILQGKKNKLNKKLTAGHYEFTMK